MNLRQAAEQALECLDYHWDNPDSELENWPYVLEAKKALREALTEPANSTTNLVEPKAASQTEQEPVAWGIANTRPTEKNPLMMVMLYEPKPSHLVIPLYTAPPKKEWVGLTDEEFKCIASKYSLSTQIGMEYFKDELEDKLKEKNV